MSDNVEHKKKSRKRSREEVSVVVEPKEASLANTDDDDVLMKVSQQRSQEDLSTSASAAPTAGMNGISIIAQPLTNPKLTKKVLKLVKKASKTKSIRRGVKEVVKAIRKKETGILILAGNISPIDVITHLPVLAEDHEIPYVFVPAKEELGSAGATKRPTSCVLVQCKAGADHSEYYETVKTALSKLEYRTE